MAETARKKPAGTVTPEAKAAYRELEAGIRTIRGAVAEIRRALRKTERAIEAQARARIRALRKEARAQVARLEAREREVAKTVKRLRGAAAGSWSEVKESADTIIGETRRTAASVVSRFRDALTGT